MISNQRTQDLIAKIEAFDIDARPVPYGFADRLAKEQNWSPDYTQQVIQEYKRFVILATISDFEVTPSHAVDEAWHLHLLYTDSYWNRLTALLPKPLHHHPTTGETHSKGKYSDQFARTVELYRETFGENPPDAIWSVTESQHLTRKKSAQVYSITPPIGRNKNHWKWFAVAGSGVTLAGCIGQAASANTLGPGWIVVGGVVLLAIGLLVYASRQGRRSNGGTSDASYVGSSCGGSDSSSSSSDSGSSCGGSGCGGGCGGGGD